MWRMSPVGGGDVNYKMGALFVGKGGSHYVILLYCETLLQVFLVIYCKRFYWTPLFTVLLLFYVFEVGKVESAAQSVLIILTLNGLLQKNFQVLYFTPKNSLSLTLPLPLLPTFFFFFFIIVFVL